MKAIGVAAWSEWIHSGEWASDDKAAIPMLPANVRELVVMATDPDIATWRVVDVVGQDPVLAAQVMRMANTAGVTPGRPVTVLDEAVRRLGTQAVRNIVLAGALSLQMADPRTYGPRGRQIVEHSLGTAVIAAKLADHLDLSSEMFLAGLLHDIGKLLVLKLAFDYQKDTGTRIPGAEIDEICRTRHPQMGGWLAGHWSIPPAIADCILWHHDPEWATDHEQVLIIYTANRLAHRYGFGGFPPERANLLDDPNVVEAGLNEDRLRKIDLSAQSIFDGTRRAIGG